MEGRNGHVLLGLVFLIIGLWHLYNHVKNNLCLKCYKSFTWFPTSFSRYLELYLILLGTSLFIFIEVSSTLPFDQDGTILAPKNFHHLEHSSIAMPFFLHALFAILLDKAQPKTETHVDVSHFLGAMAFAQELLLFHFHSTDHIGLEGQYHLLLQLVILVCIFTSLLSIWLPNSFMVCYIRSLGVIFQGIWLIIMGIMLWTPDFAPNGCSMKEDEYGRNTMVIKCDDIESLYRGKVLINILFSWFFIGVLAIGLGFCLILNKVYGANKFMADDDGEEMACHLEDEKIFQKKYRVLPIDLEN